MNKLIIFIKIFIFKEFILIYNYIFFGSVSVSVKFKYIGIEDTNRNSKIIKVRKSIFLRFLIKIKIEFISDFCYKFVSILNKLLFCK